AQVTLKMTSPGVPDIYQGCELWDFSMVDPDNRRPVDFTARHASLRELREAFAGGDVAAFLRDLLRTWTDGRIKLFTTWRLLQLRKAHAQTFLSQSYRGLGTGGKHGTSVVAFAREQIVVVVPRLVYPLLRVGADGLPKLEFTNEVVRLPANFPRTFTNVFTGETVTARSEERRLRLDVATLLTDFPVAVLVPEQ
ncbi:MAG: malto-oligosyltrehalose synthase, partial [Candidatus Eremiobacteraeota bacterium]|nr:malto-oligosyltrehalose synthase [Candidatus Eremiobacteraeota bacterium]